MTKVLNTRGGWFILIPFGDHITESDLSSPVEVTIPNDANGLLVQVETADVWFRFDGEDPNSSTHWLIKAGADAQTLPFAPGTTIKFLEAGTGAVLQHQFVRAY